MANKHSNLNSCPFVGQPMPECKVRVITSQTIPQIIECCGVRYTECPLYRNKLASSDPALSEIDT